MRDRTHSMLKAFELALPLNAVFVRAVIMMTYLYTDSRRAGVASSLGFT